MTAGNWFFIAFLAVMLLYDWRGVIATALLIVAWKAFWQGVVTWADGRVAVQKRKATDLRNALMLFPGAACGDPELGRPHQQDWVHRLLGRESSHCSHCGVMLMPSANPFGFEAVRERGEESAPPPSDEVASEPAFVDLMAALEASLGRPPRTEEEKTALEAELQDTERFFGSTSWKRVRAEVVAERNWICDICDRETDDRSIDVAHIQPRREHPELELEKSNLEIWCRECWDALTSVESADVVRAKTREEGRAKLRELIPEAARLPQGGFHNRLDWKRVRAQVVAEREWTCDQCQMDADNSRLVVSQIKPRAEFPELALSPSNLRVRCDSCEMEEFKALAMACGVPEEQAAVEYWSARSEAQLEEARRRYQSLGRAGQ